jgi:sugar phosphate isomerase/epimerase
MEFALHAACIMHTNVVTDVRVAREAGYDGIELWIPKLTRYLDAGFTANELAEHLGPLKVTILDTIQPIENADPDTRARVLAEMKRIAQVAEALNCSVVQVVALDHFDSDAWCDQRSVLVAALSELAEIASVHGVRLALEPVIFSRFRSLAQAVDVIEEVGTGRVGLCLDTWHLWISDTPWQDVAALHPSMIACVHIGDTNPKSGANWRDEDRTALPGDGILPLNEAISAIRETGYDGVWSVEMLSERHWEWDPQVLADELLRKTRSLLSTDTAA